jgi:hypothetical protein
LRSLEELNGRYSSIFSRRVDESEGNGTASSDGFGKKWGWVATVDNLANGDGTKWDYYWKLNVVEFLNRVTFAKDKQTKKELDSKRNG